MVRSNTANAADAGAIRTTAPLVGELKFETALAELEQLVQDMEGGRLPLEESLEAYRRGSELLRHCQQQLSDADRKIQILENDSLHDLEPDSGETR